MVSETVGRFGERIPSKIVIAGGEIDVGATGLEVYQGVPQTAEVPSGKACQIAKSYVDLVNRGSFAKIADLFESDAVVLDQIGKSARGHDQIDAYFSALAPISPQIIAVAYTGDDVDCMVEIATSMKIEDRSRYVLTSIDHFTLGNSGKVTRMVAFGRPVGQK
jgi:SnoaL-like domain